MMTNSDLLGFLKSRLGDWEDYRDNNYQSKWEEYYRLWRGIWQESDKTRGSERSRLISPALQQAIEAQVSELEEAIFGKGKWFDLGDDIMDQDKSDAMLVRNLLFEDTELAGTKDAIAEILFNGALYGTGIGELVLEPYYEQVLVELPIEGTIDKTSRQAVMKESTLVKLRPVSPERFLIDPVATKVSEAMGCAVIDYVGIHKIKEGIAKGYYKNVDVGTATDAEDVFAKGEVRYNLTDKVKLTTYYGLVPREHLEEEKDQEYESLFPDEESKDAIEYVEAIVIIANDQHILKAVESPYFGKDRPIVAYQHDRVPNRFWGRGVAEKGYNPQKALDAELRARIDALALSTHPMMGIDATRLPRGMKFEVAPGKSILTNGDPREVLFPLSFTGVQQSSFVQSADFERQVQVGTGSIDTAMPVGGNARNATSGGMSMMVSASIKRQKRTLMNFNENFLVPLINKMLWRYIQYRPDRYPAKDYKFIPQSTLGIMAREYEQQQFVSLLSVTPQDSPLFPVIVEGILTNSSLQNREELLMKLQQAQQPDPKQLQLQQQMQQLQMAKLAAETEYLKGQLEGIKIKAEMDAIEVAAKQLDIKQEKDYNKELDLKVKEATVGAQQEQLKIVLQEQKAQQDYDVALKRIALEAERIMIEKQKMLAEMESEAREEMKEEQSMSDIKSMLDNLSKYMTAKKTPIRDSSGNLVGVEIEGFGTKEVTIDADGNIKEIK